MVILSLSSGSWPGQKWLITQGHRQGPEGDHLAEVAYWNCHGRSACPTSFTNPYGQAAAFEVCLIYLRENWDHARRQLLALQY
ncbi:hypothetical protein TNCT_298541 [Trichonephila clavata]|uniref:Uncharacterized protein n=1 Tax=Trichonephila clavata TaxID=2740835 RepID=A0A8X6EXA0_TRICU|nr:hypothetical protein TNCT_298541 [Trichonephila clavata]